MMVTSIHAVKPMNQFLFNVLAHKYNCIYIYIYIWSLSIIKNMIWQENASKHAGQMTSGAT